MFKIFSKPSLIQSLSETIRSSSNKCKTGRCTSKAKKEAPKKNVCKPVGPKSPLPGQAVPSKASMFRNISLFGAIPFIIGLSIFIFSTRKHEERPDYVPYPHMYKRDKRFAWRDGNKSLFHNPQVNALPGIGYED